jgi:hypothetical protein
MPTPKCHHSSVVHPYQQKPAKMYLQRKMHHFSTGLFLVNQLSSTQAPQTKSESRALAAIGSRVSESSMLCDKICMMMTRLACNQAIESSYWRMDNNSDVGLLTGYVLYRLPIELESMDLDTFSH